MQRLWAPWRIKYITQMIDKTKGCVFCRIHKAGNDKRNYVFIRTKYCFAVLNIFPYNNGHVMILPYRHVRDLSLLRPEESQDLWDLMVYVKDLLDEVMHPQGFNIGMNLGRIAGAGFPGHLHIHLVPRWKGDVNFMPVVGNIKVISQSLAMLFEKLDQSHRRRIKHKKAKR